MSELQNKLIAKTFQIGVSNDLLQEALSIFEPKTMNLPKERPQNFMSEKETCRFCGGISRSTLWHWRNAGLKSYPIGGRRLFLSEDVRNFIIQQAAMKPTADTVDTVDESKKGESYHE